MAQDAQSVQVDLSSEMQRKIRDFAQNLAGQSYYDVLGVKCDAKQDDVREAFFERTNVFHPDRYFRKELGPYRGLLTEIYKRVVVAHEVLKDDKLRSEYDKRLAELSTTEEVPVEGDESVAESPRASEPEVAARSAASGAEPSLRTRKGLHSSNSLVRLQQQILRGRKKANDHFDSALRERERGDVIRAVSLIRLAMAFDPRNTGFQDVLAELLPRANSLAAERLRGQALPMLKQGEFADAVTLLEEAFELKPTDADQAFQVAELARDHTGDLEKARVFAAHAVRLDERNANYRKAYAVLLKQAGQKEEARRQFQHAWELDPLDGEVKAELGRL